MMKTVCVASGKGGAGKTSIAAALAAGLGGGTIYADCDVDAANGALALGADSWEVEPYVAGAGYSIDQAECEGCGLCASACRFGAALPFAEGKYSIAADLCERCGACLDACPAGAVREHEKAAGELRVSSTDRGIKLVHARLEPGEDTSGKLVAKVRRRAEELAGKDSVIIVDAPPGIGCPVIASLTGTDLVAVVVEASASGIRDAARLLELIRSMDRNAVGIVNKAGLSVEMDSAARTLLSGARVPIVAEIHFDAALRSIDERGATWAEAVGPSGYEARAMIAAIREVLRPRNKSPSGRGTTREGI